MSQNNTIRVLIIVTGLAAGACGQAYPPETPSTSPAPAGAAPTVPANAAGNAPSTPGTPSAPPPVNPNNVPDPNSGTASQPDPNIVINANAKAGFNPNFLYTESDNGYPSCENPAPVDFGVNQVAGCPNTIGKNLPMQSYCHIDPSHAVTWYETNPPASGDHWPEPSHMLGVNIVPVPREYWVHSMEHGAVVLAYNCPAGCAAELQVLRSVVAQRADRKYKVLMTPDPRMPPNTFAAISWTWLYLFAQPDATKLLCFIDQHYDHARENSLTL